MDLLVILECPSVQKREIQANTRKELRDFKVPKDIIVANPQDIEKYRDAWWTIYQPALEKGIVLYEIELEGLSGWSAEGRYPEGGKAEKDEWIDANIKKGIGSRVK